MKNKKRKINYKNIGLFIVFLIAFGVVIHDIIIIGTSMAQFNGFGLITFIASITTIGYICDYYDEYLENKNASVSTSNKCEK